MNDSFDECRELEKRAMADVFPLLKKQGYDVVPLVDESALSRFAQWEIGIDYALHKGGKLYTAELKAELEGRSGNFFLETESNANVDPPTPGWMRKSQADFLLYYFLDTGALFWMDFTNLKRWFWEPDILKQFTPKEQKKHPQANLTIGRPVPIQRIRSVGGIVQSVYFRRDGGVWVAP